MFSVFIQLPLVWGNNHSGISSLDRISIALTVICVFIGITMAITDNDRVKTQIKIQEKNDFNLLNKMQEGLFVLDSDREQIKFGSDTAIRIMGHKQDKLAGCDMQKNLDSSLLT